MRKRTLLIVIAAALIILAGMTLDFGFPIEKITGYSILSSDYREKQLREKYRLDFGLTKTPAGNITCYMPAYYETTTEMATRYSTVFKTPEACISDDDAFLYFSSDEGFLKVYRYVDGFIYNGFASDGTDGTLLEDEKSAIATALRYFENRYLPIGFEETKVRFNDGVYSVVFVKRLGNIKNYAYNNSIQLDERGNLLQMSYYNINFEPYRTCKIISMRDSYKSLPLNFEDTSSLNITSSAESTASSVDVSYEEKSQQCKLKSCELVYIFEDSILQPAYYYEGEITDEGKTQIYECFIKAADYEN